MVVFVDGDGKIRHKRMEGANHIKMHN